MSDYCAVHDCKNKRGEGNFVGEFCTPCWLFITTGRSPHNQVYVNAVKLIGRELGEAIESVSINTRNSMVWLDQAKKYLPMKEKK